MIISIGNDICDIRRIGAALERYGERFTKRCFTAVECERAAQSGNPAATYAKRFAAKEACAKALGTGIDHGVFLKDIGVVNLVSNRPTLELTGGALARLHAITPPGHRAHIHLGLSDELPYAQAFVILEALPS
jgi:holo-[acyl-carrier protein] synthase